MTEQVAPTSFVYNLSAKPAGSTATAQFSQNGTTWYNSSGTESGTDTLTTGTNNTISLSTLAWTGANFYYKIAFAHDGTDTPVMDDVTVNYTQTPSAPTIGAATADSTSQITWGFTDNSGIETGFRVFDTSNTQKAQCATANLSSCSESSLSANAQYTRKVAGYNGDGNGAYSSTVSKYTLIETPSLSFGTPTTTTIPLTASGVSNETAGSSGLYFDCTGASCDTGINSWTQTASDTATGLTANTQYTFQVKGRNGDSTETSYSSTSNKWTLPVAANASADQSTATNISLGTTATFTNDAGFGAGGVQYYRYVWDTSATHTWADSESTWSSANANCPSSSCTTAASTLTEAPLAVGNYYLHLKSFNGEDAANSTTQDFGPFQYVGYRLTSVPSSLATVLTSDGSTDVSDGGSNYQYGASVGVQVKKGSTKIAEVNMDMTANRDFSNLLADTDTTNHKAFVDLSSVAGAASTHTLYAPGSSSSKEIRVCPNAASLSAVTVDCSNGYNLKNGESSGSVRANYVSGNYWQISNLTGSGAVEINAPTAVTIYDPGDKNYTNNRSPTINFNKATDTDISKYQILLDDGKTGSVVLADDIPINGSRANHSSANPRYHLTTRYKAVYQNESDSDADNDRIEVTLREDVKAEIDGQQVVVWPMKEGKRMITVRVVDEAGSSTSANNAVYLDTTAPDLTAAESFRTTEQRPSFSGKISDTKAGEKLADNNKDKTRADPDRAEILLEKEQRFLGLTTDEYYALYKVNLSSNACEENVDLCIKSYAFTPSEPIAFGSYRVTMAGYDKAGNKAEKALQMEIGKREIGIGKESEKAGGGEEKEMLEAGPKAEIEEPEKQLLESPKPAEKEKLKEEALRPTRGVLTQIVQHWQGFWSFASLLPENLAVNMQGEGNAFKRMAGFLAFMPKAFYEYVIDNEPTRIDNVQIAELTAETAIITWQTNHFANSKVNWGETRSYGSSVFDKRKVHFHQMAISGLEPGTTYHFEVMSQNKNYVYDADHEFETPLPKETKVRIKGDEGDIINLREKPRLDAKILAKVSEGEEFEFAGKEKGEMAALGEAGLGESDEWWKVKLGDGKEAFVFGELGELTKDGR